MKQGCVDINFKLNNILKNKIKGGSIPLDSFITQKQLAQSSYIIKKYRLIYFDQLLATDGISLLSWSEIISRPCYASPNISTSKIPVLYSLISSLVIESSYNKLGKWKPLKSVALYHVILI